MVALVFRKGLRITLYSGLGPEHLEGGVAIN